MGASHSEGNQGTAYHPALRHAQDVPDISQSPRSGRTQQFEPFHSEIPSTTLRLVTFKC